MCVCVNVGSVTFCSITEVSESDGVNVIVMRICSMCGPILNVEEIYDGRIGVRAEGLG